MTHARRAVWAFVLVACGAPPAAPAPTEMPLADAPIESGPVAATVDGEPISLAEVERTARDTGLSPLAALHRLEQERALLHHAAQASLDTDDEAERATRRASVQALLRARIEDPVGDGSVTDEEIAARYAASRTSWAQPERRTSVHVLAAPHADGGEAARAAADRFARTAIARIAASADPVAEANAIGAEAAEGRTFDVRVETLPPTARHGALAEPFLAALFSLSTPGVVPDPVTTSFGVHAIVLVSIEPAFEMPLAEATPILRRQLVAEHRGAALDALTSDLRAHSSVAVDERLAARVFAADLAASP